MRKVVRLAVVGLVAWVAVSVAWGSVAYVTGLPGPADVTAGSLELTARAVTVVQLPGPLAVPQRLAARTLHRSSRVVRRAYRGPERLVDRTLGRALRRLGVRGTAVGSAWALEPPRASRAPESPGAPSVAPPAVVAVPGSRVHIMRLHLPSVRHEVERALREGLDEVERELRRAGIEEVEIAVREEEDGVAVRARVIRP